MAYLMIVDDDENLAEALAVAMTAEGHEVATSSDIAVAMAEMQRRPPDLVILDVMFPEDDFAGFELARQMRKCRDLNRIPILMLTSLNRSMGLCFSTLDTDNSWLPVAEFLNKPVDLQELAGKVKSLLQGAGPQPGHTGLPS